MGPTHDGYFGSQPYLFLPAARPLSPVPIRSHGHGQKPRTTICVAPLQQTSPEVRTSAALASSTRVSSPNLLTIRAGFFHLHRACSMPRLTTTSRVACRGRCRHGSPGQRRSTIAHPLLQMTVRSATKNIRRCYRRPAALLQAAAVAATEDRRPCYKRPPALLQKTGGLTTRGRRRCSKLLPALLQKVAGSATSCLRRSYGRPPTLL
jgi:hypothetical protein